jgi:hypothetical protein
MSLLEHPAFSPVLVSYVFKVSETTDLLEKILLWILRRPCWDLAEDDLRQHDHARNKRWNVCLKKSDEEQFEDNRH